MAFESQGAMLFVSTSTAASTAAAALVGQVKDFNAVTGSAAVIDVTHLNSTAKEKMIGLPDEGQVSFTVNMNATDAGQVNLRVSRASRLKRKMSLFLNDGMYTRIDCDCYVMSMPITGSVDNALTQNITMELSGMCTYSSVAALPT